MSKVLTEETKHSSILECNYKCPAGSETANVHRSKMSVLG